MIRAVCLTPQEISDYLQGRLPEEQSSSIEEHLSSCDRCEATVRRLDESSDSLIRHLRLTPEPESEDEQWEDCLNSLRSLPGQTVESAEPGEAVSLDQVLRPKSVYHYRLDQQLGQGGMGVVYRSWHPQLHRPVAIKILSASRATDASSIARFQREMRAAGGLDHPGIVRAVDAGIWQGTYYLVMEYIDGVDLSRLVRRCGPLDAADACEMMVQAAESLQFAHDRQTVHRDIKPSNLILTRDGVIKILDFGLARLERGGLTGHDATTAGRLVGTLDYLSPEQAAGRDPIDSRSDLYGLGATLFRLLSGRPPHGSSQNRPVLQYLQEVTSVAPPSLDSIRADLPPQLCQIVAKLLSRDPQYRPADAEQVATLLRPFRDGADLKALVEHVAEVSSSAEDSPIDSRDVTAHRSTEQGPDILPVRSTGPIRRRLVTRLAIALGCFLIGIAGGLGGLTLWLKTGEAVVEIQSEVDDVSLQLIADGEIAKQIEVHPGNEVTRVRVGKYELKITGNTDRVLLDQQGFDLMRGDRRMVRIRRMQERPAAVAIKGTEPVAPGEDPTTQTIKGRTYRQWTDIVLREQDPATVVDAVSALASLGTAARHEQTFETLMQVVKKNESRGSEIGCDDYISLLTEVPEEEIDRSRRPVRGSERVETDYTWIRNYPKVSDNWKSVVEAIVAALDTLPEETIASSMETVVESEAESSKLMLLFHAAKSREKNHERKDLLVQRLCEQDQSDQVRALANHIWLTVLDRAPAEPQRLAIQGDAPSLAKAVTMTLMKTKQYPFGREMGIACGAMIVENDAQIGAYIRALAARSLAEGESFRQSQEGILLQSLAAEIVRRWNGSTIDLVRLQGAEYLQLLASVSLIDRQTRQSASQFLHQYLQQQLVARGKIDDPRQVDSSTMWVLFVVRALTAIDHRLPDELEQYKMQPGSPQAEAFSEWVAELREGSEEAERAMSMWTVQFPLQTMQKVIEVGSEQLVSARQNAGMRRFSALSRSPLRVRILDQVYPVLLIPYAAKHLHDESVQSILGYVLENAVERGLDQLQLDVPLPGYRDPLMSIAQDGVVGESRGLVLYLAQSAGADDAQVQQFAMKRILSRKVVEDRDDPTPGAAAPHEMAWMVQCLADADQVAISEKEFDEVNERIVGASYRSAIRKVSDLQRAIVASLKLSERGLQPDPRIVYAAFGIKMTAFKPGWANRSPSSRFESEGDERSWKIMSGGVPAAVMKQALATITANPIADEAILESLKSKQALLLRFAEDDSLPAKAVADAIVAIENALTKEE